MARFSVSCVANISQKVYNKDNCKIIDKAAERRRRKATRACTVCMAAVKPYESVGLFLYIIMG
ncbi:hypothetical protein SDC9_165788 [bioreactor metagenome]|uniref:Uncharacterized protein n=1 Tax=bioreactor metagenome TaxID=1076179 RepID=A0A645FV68_9ZZZZ